MIASDKAARSLAGKTIKEIFNDAEDLAELHACLTSPRGDYFRFRLLQAMEVPLGEAALGQLRLQSGIHEYNRHLHMLMSFGLVKERECEGGVKYLRTPLAERAINTVRELERRVTDEVAQAIYSASLGPNSIRFFLRIYGDTPEASWGSLKVKYTLAEMGKLSLFLPRVIDGISAVDKLNDAGLVVYQDDNHVHLQAVKARSFYQYLRELYGILKDGRTQRTGPGLDQA